MAHYLDSFPEHHISIHNKTYIYFGGTAYLGLQTDVDFQNIFIENIRKYGTNYGASRKSNIRMAVYDEAETYLSKLVGSEACISMSSGYLAGQLVAHGLNTNNHAFFYAPNTHSALRLSSNKSQSFSTYEDLKEALHLHLKLKTDETPVVFLDAVDFSGSHFPDFEGLKTLPLSELILVVDDSHGIGILGERGGGIYKTIKDLNPKELIVCASLGKGFGVQAGAIFGCKSRISSLENTAFFGGSSPASPANLATLLHSEGIYNIKRKQLKDNTDFFIDNLNLLDKFQYMIGHPAFSFSDEHLNNHLESNGIIVTSFRYPDENSPMMSRIVISASHTETDILRLCEVLNNA
ncbi:aminotransferase class I/II-fold pyridoxal phosphate-dependent enzyme [Algibacter miyuki]|uniref:Aminotransferase class I/II-fold pyridoxal phosphate-dependent enzyme n=1 Tax=Algibacter miyuki TaxID=1306933 RepID=A0ABV5GXB7_9FLAO|nr:aminotransferase class I/II-fold pyridoxal phosphate-dependent enzyme [Algibacter miyuki]MDN3665000.1 aminotransferase class I/II-fold pyridoxal phosphate-dependent enzyme [Algibacter miyuki]